MQAVGGQPVVRSFAAATPAAVQPRLRTRMSASLAPPQRRSVNAMRARARASAATRCFLFLTHVRGVPLLYRARRRLDWQRATRRRSAAAAERRRDRIANDAAAAAATATAAATAAAATAVATAASAEASRRLAHELAHARRLMREQQRGETYDQWRRRLDPAHPYRKKLATKASRKSSSTATAAAAI